ncbi:hypothetical protein ACFLRQ_00450 [Bacteroidota bacterium]
MKKLLILFAVMLISIPVLSQDRSKFLYAEFSDKSVSLYPSLKFFGNSFDPSVTVGGGIDYKQKGNFTSFQTFQLTGFKTRFTGNGATLTSSFGYRYGLASGFFGEVMAGLGSTAFFPSRETFAQNEDGDYVQVNPLIVRAALPLDIVIGYKSGNYAFYLQYKYMLIAPYTDILFVPMLGVSQTGVGIRYTINHFVGE